MRVLRIENDQGVGPYAANIGGTFWENDEFRLPGGEYRRHPTPEWDYITGTMDYLPRQSWEGMMICGFANAQQLYQWFSARVVALLEMRGFLVRIFDVDDDNVIPLDHQVLFLKPEGYVPTPHRYGY